MKNKKVLLIICLIIIITASIVTNIYILNNEIQSKKNSGIEGIVSVNNEEILKDTVIDNLKVTNISLLTGDGISTYKATITNTNNKEIEISKFYVVFYEGTNYNKILAVSNINLNPNDCTEINIATENDLSKTTNIQYTIE